MSNAPARIKVCLHQDVAAHTCTSVDERLSSRASRELVDETKVYWEDVSRTALLIFVRLHQPALLLGADPGVRAEVPKAPWV